VQLAGANPEHLGRHEVRFTEKHINAVVPTIGDRLIVFGSSAGADVRFLKTLSGDSMRVFSSTPTATSFDSARRSETPAPDNNHTHAGWSSEFDGTTRWRPTKIRTVQRLPVAALGRLYQARLIGDDDKLGAVPGVELGQQPAHVSLGGCSADVQILPDL